MEYVAPIITAVIAAFLPIGGGIAWLWNKFDAIDRQLDACREDSSVKLVVIELMWQEIERLAPNSPILARVKKLLDELRQAERRNG